MTTRAAVLHLIARAIDLDVAELHDGYELGAELGYLGPRFLADLAMDLEADLSVEVPDEEVERWATVGDVVKGMKRLVAAAKEEERGRAPLSKRGKKKPDERVEQGSLLS